MSDSIGQETEIGIIERVYACRDILSAENLKEVACCSINIERSILLLIVQICCQRITQLLETLKVELFYIRNYSFVRSLVCAPFSSILIKVFFQVKPSIKIPMNV